MSEPLPYSEVVKIEALLWEECMPRLPHALDCAAWIYVIGPEDRTLDDNSCDKLKMSDLVLGLEVDFWDEIPRKRFYADDIHNYLENKDACLELFDGFAMTYIEKVENGTASHSLKKSVDMPDTRLDLRPEWLKEWQVWAIQTLL